MNYFKPSKKICVKNQLKGDIFTVIKKKIDLYCLISQ